MNVSAWLVGEETEITQEKRRRERERETGRAEETVIHINIPAGARQLAGVQMFLLHVCQVFAGPEGAWWFTISPDANLPGPSQLGSVTSHEVLCFRIS
ncbi:unnamed protein product [Arctogadus glacialis]